MAHKTFCDIGGHFYECTSLKCMCICGLPFEEGDHGECPLELRACPKHEKEIGPAELAAVKEAGAIEIQFPTKLPEVLKQVANDGQNYEGFCLWCGHGYEKYTPKLEDEHFAYNCPGAPAPLRENAMRRLSRRATKGK